MKKYTFKKSEKTYTLKKIYLKKKNVCIKNLYLEKCILKNNGYLKKKRIL